MTARNHGVELEDLELGPAMRACTERQRKMVYGFVYEGLNKTDAIKYAGYEPTSANGNVWGYFQHPKVQAAIEELARGLLKSHAPGSIRTLLAIRDNVDAPPDVRRKAANDILDRAGISTHTQHTLHVEHHLSERDKDARLLALADELGFDAEMKRRLLAPPTKPIDVEFVAVPSPAEQSTND